MMEITGTDFEIKKIKEVLWFSSDCLFCKIPNDECDKCTKFGCSIDDFYKCIESKIKFSNQ